MHLSETMRKGLSILIVLLGVVCSIQAQEVVWAEKVLGFSSQMSYKKYSANQILGKPNVLPNHEHNPCAWVPKRDRNPNGEWILVEFENPIRTRQVAVAENFNPGSISRIILFDTEDEEHIAYYNDSLHKVHVDGRMFRVSMKLTSKPIKAAKIVLNTQGHTGWSHIDAIGISESSEPIRATINVAATLAFSSRPVNLGTTINSRYNEIMPVISPDGNTLYFNRKDHPNNTGGHTNDDIWFSTLDHHGFWNPAMNIGPPLNNTGHNYITSISPDGNVALLGNVYQPGGNMTPGLSISYKANRGFGEPNKLVIKNFDNLSDYGEYHLAADGKTIVMTIERKDGFGGKDVYVSFLEEFGRWSEPMNLGSIVNTAGTEMSPFLAADGKSLYFSSNGFSGFGKNDMYLTRRLDDTWENWSEPQNLGEQLNSEKWDAYYSIPAAGDYAYFSSEKGSIGKADIFRIKLPREIQPDPVVLVKGIVLNDKTGRPVQAKIVYETLETGKEVGVAVSNPANGEYQIVLPAGENYGFRAEAEGFLSVTEHIYLNKTEAYEERQVNLSLVPIFVGETVVLNNIFFRPGRAEIIQDSKPELSRLLEFLEGTPGLRIEIGGHTDNTCQANQCIRLSTARSKAVADWLTSRGIPSSRIEYKGYGSASPIADNSTSEGRKKNRRVEFTILEM